MKLRTVLLSLTAVAAAGAITLAAVPAFADTPLPAPTNLHALHISDTSADLDWLHDGQTAQDVVERKVNNVWTEYARTNAGFLALSGLTPGATYTFRVYSIPVAGLGYTTSARSAPLSFTTLSGPDTVPPAKPVAPTFSSITTASANVFWPETTDNVQVTGYYVQQLVSGAWTTIRTVGSGQTFQAVNGLQPSTSYSYAVIAFDARGNQSPRSDTGVLTTLATTTGVTCKVQLVTFPPGFTTTITVLNSTSAAITNWNVQFTAPLTTNLFSPFNSSLSRNGTAITLTPAIYYATLNPGVQATVGFSGQSGTPFAPPSGFTAAGVPCTVA